LWAFVPAPPDKLAAKLGFEIVADDLTVREKGMETLRYQYVPRVIEKRTFFVSSRVKGGLPP
jgi:hypothetical protein